MGRMVSHMRALQISNSASRLLSLLLQRRDQNLASRLGGVIFKVISFIIDSLLLLVLLLGCWRVKEPVATLGVLVLLLRSKELQ